LLERIDFQPGRDRLWFAGDLVNRGPKSLETLRFVKGLGKSALTVLGNHDLHLLAAANGNKKKLKDKEEGLKAILRAPDGEELCAWLQGCPLLHHDASQRYTLVHAGLPPLWELVSAHACAREVEAQLQSKQARSFFKQMYGNEPDRWSKKLSGMDRYRFTTNCLTRMRYCDAKGRLMLKEKGPPGSQDKGIYPWFMLPERKTRDQRIIFGHWSTLGYKAMNNCWAIDSGCLWGGPLTALRLDLPKPQPIQEPCVGALTPGED
jgi:bis(5'-nucleosyl)-tetraphosphatase (symmetrical)